MLQSVKSVHLCKHHLIYENKQILQINNEEEENLFKLSVINFSNGFWNDRQPRSRLAAPRHLKL